MSVSGVDDAGTYLVNVLDGKSEGALSKSYHAVVVAPNYKP